MSRGDDQEHLRHAYRQTDKHLRLIGMFVMGILPGFSSSPPREHAGHRQPKKIGSSILLHQSVELLSWQTILGLGGVSKMRE